MARRRDLTVDFYARKLREAQAHIDSLTPEPRPRASLQIHSVEQVSETRRVGCVRYGACLNLAFASRWEGFSCNGCRAFALPEREDYLADMDGLTLLLVALVKRQPLFFEEEVVQTWTF